MAKNKKEKFIHGFKLYNYVMQEIWKLITTLIFGIVVGLLLEKNGPDDNNYFVIVILIAMVVGLVNFFIGIIRIARKEEKSKIEKKELTENETKEL